MATKRTVPNRKAAASKAPPAPTPAPAPQSEAPKLDRKSFFSDLSKYQEESATRRDWVPPPGESLTCLYVGVNPYHAEDCCVMFFKFQVADGEYAGQTFSIRQSTKAGWLLDEFLEALLPEGQFTGDWPVDFQAAEKLGKEADSYFQVETSERQGKDGKFYPEYEIEPINMTE